MSNQASILKRVQDNAAQYEHNPVKKGVHDGWGFEEDLFSRPTSSCELDPLSLKVHPARDQSNWLTGISTHNNQFNGILPQSIPKQKDQDKEPSGIHMPEVPLNEYFSSESFGCLNDHFYCNGLNSSIKIHNHTQPTSLSHGVPEAKPHFQRITNDAYSYFPSQTSMDSSPGFPHQYIPLESSTKWHIAKILHPTNLNPQDLQSSKHKNDKDKLKAKELSGTEPFKTISPDYSNIEVPEDAFEKISPLLTKVTQQSFPRILVHCFRSYHHHISLDSFFNLLYTGKYSDTLFKLPRAEYIQDDENEGKTLRFCCHILNWFHDSQLSRDRLSGDIREREISAVNFHEFLRTFFAIKILLACTLRVETSQGKQSALSRLACYKMYYIICQRYTGVNKVSSNFSLESIILGQSKLGHLIHLVYPNLVIRRLGRRGNSKFHYMGMGWNYDLVDTKMLKLLELDVPELRRHFDTQPTKSKKVLKVKELVKRNSEISSHTCASSQSHSPFHVSSNWKIPLHSFVDISYTYPEYDCSPRVWNFSPNKVPRQSEWSSNTIKKCMTALTKYNIDLQPLLENLHSRGMFNEADVDLSPTVLKTMKRLQTLGVRKEIYLCFYLIVLLTFFPIMIASDAEVPLRYKARLCDSLSVFTRELDGIISTTNDVINLKNFISNLKKMANLSKMSSCQIKQQYAEIILEEKISEITLAGSTKAHGSGKRSQLEEIHINSIIRSFIAFNFKLAPETCLSKDEGEIASIYALANTLLKSLVMTTEDMQNILVKARSGDSSEVPRDLPYQIFKITIQRFHEYSFADPLVKKLPIPAFSYILRNISEIMQSGSVDNFQKSDVELSKEIFKCWWVFFMMLQDYLDLLSEVVSLNALLGKFINNY